MPPLTKKYNLTTFNCNSIKSGDRFQAFQSELTKLKKIDVLGLAETWIPGQTCSRLNCAELNQKVVGVKYISDRIIQVLLKLRAGKTLRVTQVYAPQSGLGNDEYDAFLDQLSSSLARPVTHDVVLGDFNASTGPRRYGEQYIVLSKVSGSDHRMVRATVKLPLRVNRSRPYNHVKPEYDRLELIFTMIEHLRQLPIAESPNEELNQLKHALSSTAKSCARRPTLLTRLSPLSLALMERRRLMKHGLTDRRFAMIEYAEN
uniref:Endonuclease/exonuclease/phosphatase domain-containing protein n=1 Tax=Panagrolaimus superbus TaxID=310955 RepID=A0A914YEE0_9BILA